MSLDPKLYQQLIETFKEELQEQHQKLISELLKLEQSNKHSASEILKNLFRLSHNIKGEAKCVAIESIASISHHLEDLFSEWRNK